MILRAAIAAPSADNSQPWRFTWHDDALDLRIDPMRSGGVSDGRFVLSDLAAGACVENMLIAARASGHAADVTVFPDLAGDERWVARLQWRRDPAVGPEPLAAAVPLRHTDRRFPWSGPMDAATWARLEAAVGGIPGARLWRPDSPRQRSLALGIVRRAESLRFRSPVLHQELFGSIRFGAGWHSTCDEGLAPATLAVEALLRPAFQAMRRPAVMRWLNRLGAPSMLGWRSAWLPIRLSPGLCLIVMRSGSRADVVAGGRALQRAWLAATLDGLVAQPYAAAGVLGLGFVRIEPSFQRQTARLASALEALCGGGCGLVFLRLGRARSNVPVRSGRRPAADFGVQP